MHATPAATSVGTAVPQPPSTFGPSPGFLEQYRARFPAIVASAERFMATAEKSARKARTAGLEGSGVPVFPSGLLYEEPAAAGDLGAGGDPEPDKAPLAVSEEAYNSLPAFVRGQLPFALLESMLAALREALNGTQEFELATVEGLGHATKAKAFMNALLKMGLARLRVRAGQETVYVLA
ncbi:hypothetical protein QBZ16_002092 [Prototheca wickerhamii]|uniref:Uncharacterized protein n=1 Tax=Prototheca wickerhamii TaxID=3111 RepID=A0AAD9MJD2_PROWI|nr:hypothetical protein QBZ16_002092 [Prototheca wickerhamii]